MLNWNFPKYFDFTRLNEIHYLIYVFEFLSVLYLLQWLWRAGLFFRSFRKISLSIIWFRSFRFFWIAILFKVVGFLVFSLDVNFIVWEFWVLLILFNRVSACSFGNVRFIPKFIEEVLNFACQFVVISCLRVILVTVFQHQFHIWKKILLRFVFLTSQLFLYCL